MKMNSGGTCVLRRAALMSGTAFFVWSAHPGVAAGQAVADDGASIEQIVVTGTRIQSGNLTSSAPVVSIDSGYLDLSGQTILSDVLQEVPSLVGSRSGNLEGDAAILSGGAGDGTASLNLRNLGVARTLVLVNGRRHVASQPGTAVVDINSIPNALVERVEVLTGGASAIYGADGVSGVVNFVLKDDFEGIDAEFSTNLPDDSGGKNYLVSLTGGGNFGGDRGNIAVNFEYFHQQGLRAAQRGVLDGVVESVSLNPADFAAGDADDDPNIPDRILVARQGIPFTAIEGVVFSGEFDGSFIPNFLGDGTPFDPGIILDDGQTIGGDGLFDLFPINSRLISPQDRYTVNLLSHYDIADSARAFLEFKYVRSEIVRDLLPTAIDDFLPIRFDNPFIPDAITPAPVFFDEGTGDPIDLIFMGRDDFDLGFSEIGGGEEVDDRDLFRLVAGVKGDITDTVGYEVSYVFGRVDRSLRTIQRLEDRFAAAVDAVVDPATGDIVCRSGLDPAAAPPSLLNFPGLPEFLFVDPNTGVPKFNFFSRFDARDFGTERGSFTPGANSGCAPINIFGFNQASDEARLFVTAPVTNRSQLTQHVVSAVVSGDSSGLVDLPAGPLGFAVGFEYREEKSSFTPDPLFFQNAVTFDPPTPPTVGQFDVVEAFAEVLIPIIQDRAFFQDVSVGGAVRFSDYSTIGSTLTWQSNGTWTVSDDITFRGSYARAIRAPNINELFAPPTLDFFEPADPCLPANRVLGTQFRLDNCRADLAAVGIALEDYTQAATGPFQAPTSGNPNLREETSDSFTAGAVITPRFLPGLSLTVDYWKIDIEDGILLPDIGDLINQCYDLPTLDNEFCAPIARSPLTGNIVSAAVQDVNIAFFQSAGIDFEAMYSFDLAGTFGSEADWGDVRARVVGTKLQRLDVVTSAGGVVDDEVGELTTLLGESAPEYIVNLDLTWFWRKFTLNYQYRWQSGTLRVERLDLQQEPDIQEPFETRDFHNHDISLNYQINDAINVFAGVNNLAKPPREIGFLRRDRVFFLGVRFRADSFSSLGGLF